MNSLRFVCEELFQVFEQLQIKNPEFRLDMDMTHNTTD